MSDKFGELIRLQYCSVTPSTERILSPWQFSTFLGVWYNIPFGQTGISFQPSVETGLIFQGTKTKQGYDSLNKTAFVDFIFQLCPSFRLKNEKILNNHIEIEFSPLWILIPEKTVGMLFIGTRLGLMYIFDL